MATKSNSCEIFFPRKIQYSLGMVVTCISWMTATGAYLHVNQSLQNCNSIHAYYLFQMRNPLENPITHNPIGSCHALSQEEY